MKMHPAELCLKYNDKVDQLLSDLDVNGNYAMLVELRRGIVLMIIDALLEQTHIELEELKLERERLIKKRDSLTQNKQS